MHCLSDHFDEVCIFVNELLFFISDTRHTLSNTTSPIGGVRNFSLRSPPSPALLRVPHTDSRISALSRLLSPDRPAWTSLHEWAWTAKSRSMLVSLTISLKIPLFLWPLNYFKPESERKRFPCSWDLLLVLFFVRFKPFLSAVLSWVDRHLRNIFRRNCVLFFFLPLGTSVTKYVFTFLSEIVGSPT